MDKYKSCYCKSCYYQNSADESIYLNKSGRLLESDLIKPCDLCDGKLCWIWNECDPKEEFKEE